MQKKRVVLYGPRAVSLLLTTSLFGLCACKQQTDTVPSSIDAAQLPAHVETLSVGASTLNYTPWYIHEWAMNDPKTSNVSGWGPNVMPADSFAKPSGGGAETCCSDIPRDWRPELRLTVRWLADKKQDGKTPGYWYKADNVRIPKYRSIAGSLWAIFLPGDRVRISVPDGKTSDTNPYKRPSDDDPYIAQGRLDEEWNRLYRDGGNTQ